MDDHQAASDTRTDSKIASVTPKSDSAIEIERLCQIAVTCFNIRDFAHKTDAGEELLSHVSPRFEANHGYWAPKGLTYVELLQAWKQETVDYPNCHFEVLNIFHDIDEDRGIATLHIESEVSGRDETTVMALSQLHWRRRSAEAPWIWMRFTGFRSGFDTAGFV
ncbi:hypothetical protein DOTSEDRAFT_32470 [Dothistroma septosporum NZE10]|uniref:SnoaL-like domain-containing protein n=1 Tax=Dothistroma septosporum (strain NZE10 / CBS 128990) TaxID=675120 RepID=N1PXB1_DOTSN|nr:hypothetical protein DOTSEDRAFT_32470 [Dothistroma septosporum NZE10]